MATAHSAVRVDPPDYPVLVFPPGLFGRGSELARLTAAAEHPQAGAAMLVQGPPGIGKSALLQELRKHVLARGGWCAYGAFTEQTLPVPYAGLALALADLAQQILAEPAPRLRRLQQQLRLQLGSHGALLTTLAPEFERILGAQPSLPAAASDQRSQLLSTLRQVFSTLAGEACPLVLCIDDLQWADIGSLEMLRRLLLESSRPDMLIVLAARTETPVSPAVQVTLAELSRLRPDIPVLFLGPLDQPAFLQILATAVADGIAVDLAQSAAALHAVAQGNPLLLRQALFAPEPSACWLWDEQSQRWGWNPAAAHYLPASTQLHSMIELRLRHMTAATLELLAVAACAGYTIDPAVLGALMGVSAGQVTEALRQGMAAGLVIASGGPSAQPDRCRFAHGEIQRALLDRLDGAQRRAIHLQIGDFLLRNSQPEARGSAVFAIVSHLSAALDPARDRARAADMAALLLEASRMALRISAIDTATDYAGAAIAWAEQLPDGWQTHYALALAVYELAARTALYTGNYDGLARYSRIVLQHAHTAGDKVGVYQSSITGATLQGDYAHAIDLLCAGLAELRVHIPRRPGAWRLLTAYLRTRLALRRRTNQDLRAIPTTTVRTWWAAGDLITSAYMALQWRSENLLIAYLALEGVRWSVQHGATPFSVLAYTLYALLLINRFGDVAGSYQFAQLAVESSRRPENDHQRAGVMLTVNALVLHHSQPIAATVEPLHQARCLALEDGDVRLATDCTLTYIAQAYLAGAPLADLAAEGAAMIAELAPYGETVTLLLCRMLHQHLLNLTGACDPPYTLSVESCSEAEALTTLQETGNRFGLYAIYTLKTQMALWFDEPQAAVAAADQAAAYADAVGHGLFLEAAHCAADALARLAWLDVAPADEHRRQHRLIRQDLRQLRRLAARTPANHLHRLRLVEAELAQRRAQADAAAEAYASAWSAATANGFTGDEAFTAEMAERHCLRRRQFDEAAEWRRRAYAAYRRWGSCAKVRHLNRPLLIFAAEAGLTEAAAVAAVEPEEQPDDPGRDLPAAVTGDLCALNEMATPQEITQQLLANLLARLQADRVLFLHVQDEQVVLMAEQSAGSGAPLFLGLPLGDHSDPAAAPFTLIRLALRTREAVTAGPGNADVPAERDPYLSAQTGHLRCAILCTPLRTRGHTTALVVVERPAPQPPAEYAGFTAAEMHYVEALGAHAALLTENSYLHQRLAHAADPASGGEPGAELSAWLLGALRVVHRRHDISALLQGRLRDLVAMLLLQPPDQPLTRSELATRLWPDTAEDHGLNSLRNLLHRLRSAWPEVTELLEITRYQIQWKPAATRWVDVHALERGVAEAAHLSGGAAIDLLRRSVTLYNGPLLPGANEEWILPAQERVAACYLGALSRLVDLLIEEHDLAGALSWAQRLAAASPLHEEPYRHLIRIYGLLGDTTAARRAYEECAAMLAAEFGAAPSLATAAVYRQFAASD